MASNGNGEKNGNGGLWIVKAVRSIPAGIWVVILGQAAALFIWLVRLDARVEENKAELAQIKHVVELMDQRDTAAGRLLAQRLSVLEKRHDRFASFVLVRFKVLPPEILSEPNKTQPSDVMPPVDVPDDAEPPKK